MEPINAPNNLIALLPLGPDLAPPPFDASLVPSTGPTQPIFPDKQAATVAADAGFLVEWSAWVSRQQTNSSHGEPGGVSPRSTPPSQPHDDPLGVDLEQQLGLDRRDAGPTNTNTNTNTGPVKPPAVLPDNSGGGGKPGANAAGPSDPGVTTPPANAPAGPAGANQLRQLASIAPANPSHGQIRPYKKSDPSPTPLNLNTGSGSTGGIATSTSLTSSPNPSTFGQTVTETAIVTGSGSGGGTPTGTMDFEANGMLLGSATLDSNGVATFTTSALPVGNDTLDAFYSGDSTFASSSAETVQVVAQNIAGFPVSITATVPSTPPKTLRNNQWPNPMDLSFTSKQVPITGRGLSLQFDDVLFRAPNSLVLIENSAVAVPLTVASVNGTPDITFQVVRDPSDAKELGQTDTPTITKTGTNTANLSTNAYGTFQVLAFVDSDGDGKWQSGEGGVTLPLSIVRVEAVSDKSRTFSSRVTATFLPNARTWGAVQISAGTPKAPGVSFTADVKLLGSSGFDRVFLGWVNNVTLFNGVATYQNGSRVTEQIVSNKQAATIQGAGFNPSIFLPGDPAPDPLAFPVLDTSRTLTPNGGQDATLSTSQSANRVGGLNTLVASVTANDAPFTRFGRGKPGAPGTELRQVQFDFGSTTYLVGWTNSTGTAAPVAGAQNSVGYRTFSVVDQDSWTVNANFAIVPPARPRGRYTIKRIQAAITKMQRVVHAQAVPGSTTNLEVRPPLALASLAYDAH